MRGEPLPLADRQCNALTEKPTPSVTLLPILCFSATSPLAVGECTNLKPSSSLLNRVMPALGVAFFASAAIASVLRM